MCRNRTSLNARIARECRKQQHNHWPAIAKSHSSGRKTEPRSHCERAPWAPAKPFSNSLKNFDAVEYMFGKKASKIALAMDTLQKALETKSLKSAKAEIALLQKAARYFVLKTKLPTSGIRTKALKVRGLTSAEKFKNSLIPTRPTAAAWSSLAHAGKSFCAAWPRPCHQR